MPLDQMLPGVTMVPLPEGHEVETVYLLMKIRSTTGGDDYGWSWRSPEVVNQEELLGALVSQTDLLRRQMLDAWED